MSNAALINLVRESTLADSVEDHDYGTAGEPSARHDEIKLQDPDGVPCAIPLPFRYQSLDHRFNLITGNRGRQLRQTRRDLSFNIDYIDTAVAAQLERWAHERARVLVSPGFGRNTEFAYRPLRIGGVAYRTYGGTAYDLTGNHAIQAAQSASALFWDEVTRMFVPVGSSSTSKLANTPAGVGLVTGQSRVNRMSPPHPDGATANGGAAGAGLAGYQIGGTYSADVSFSFDSTGFGHADCPGSVRVDVASRVTAKADRYLRAQGIWDSGHATYQGYTFTGAGIAFVAVWLKGRLPNLASLTFGHPADYTELDLSGRRFDGWTPVIVAHNSSDWSAAIPQVVLNLGDSDGMPCQFEFGPTMVSHVAGSNCNPAAWWTDELSTATGDSLVEAVSSSRLPGQGTLLAGFYLPPWFHDAWNTRVSIPLLGNSDFGLAVGVSLGGFDYLQVFDSSGNHTEFVASLGLFNPGEMNTVAVTYSGAGTLLYANGEYLAAVDESTNRVDLAGSSGALQVAAGGADPARVFDVRVDEGAMTATEIKNLHLAMTDPTAVQFARAARGRVYNIVGVPSTVRSSLGGSQVFGTLSLEQVDYKPWLADPTNREVNLP